MMNIDVSTRCGTCCLTLTRRKRARVMRHLTRWRRYVIRRSPTPIIKSISTFRDVIKYKQCCVSKVEEKTGLFVQKLYLCFNFIDFVSWWQYHPLLSSPSGHDQHRNVLRYWVANNNDNLVYWQASFNFVDYFSLVFELVCCFDCGLTLGFY